MANTPPKYLAIAEQIAGSIRMQQRYNGDRLPAQRDLATRLGVTVGTVTRAYAVLERLGLVVARVGDGTYVRYEAGASTPVDTINLAFNVPVVVPEAADALHAALVAIAAEPWVLREMLDYQPELGLLRHREAGARWLASLGLTADPQRIMLTNGAQHGLATVLRSFAHRGDVVLTESLGYHGLRTLGHQLGLQIVGVETDGEGLKPDSLERAIRTYRPRWLYCIPTLQMPTGTTMSWQRRNDIAMVMSASELLLVEDCVHALLPEDPLPALASWLPRRAFLLASLSKVVTPGLRLGFVEADPSWFGKMAATMRADSLMTAPLLAEIASHWLGSGRVATMVEAQRASIAMRRQLVQDVLAGSAAARSGLLQYHVPRDFPFVWLRLNHSGPLDVLDAALRARGVLVRLASHFNMGRGQTVAGLRLSLGSVSDPEALVQGVGVVVQTVLDCALPAATRPDALPLAGH